MNFFPIRLDAGAAILPDGTRIPAPPLGTDRAMLGIRPEHFVPVPDEAGAITTEIALVEPLGSDTLVHFRLGESDYVARVSPDLRPRAGERMRFAVPPAKMRLFDEASGQALA
jgi:multiple sugar transport system ATP-binding protein